MCVCIYKSTREGMELESERPMSSLFYNPFNNFFIFRKKTAKTDLPANRKSRSILADPTRYNR